MFECPQGHKVLASEARSVKCPQCGMLFKRMKADKLMKPVTNSGPGVETLQKKMVDAHKELALRKSR